MIQIIKNNGLWAVNINGYYENQLNSEEAIGCVIAWVWTGKIHIYLKTEEQWKALCVDRPDDFQKWIGE